MNFLRLLPVAFLAFPSAGQAANFINTNFNEHSGRQLPVSTVSGEPIVVGGVAQIGTFASDDPSALIGALSSLAGRDALLDDFIPFGPSTSFGLDFSGLISQHAMEAIPEDSPLVGKPIFTLIGNESALATSTEWGIVRHPVFFEADPTIPNQFFISIDISNPYSSILFGTQGPAATTPLGPSPYSLGLVTVPEPGSAAMLAMALVPCLRRRRVPSSR